VGAAATLSEETMKDTEYYIRLAAKDGNTRSGMILGIRLALVGLQELAINDLAEHHRDLVIYVETDRCLPDAIELVTGCRLGNRTLKFQDLGKMAAVFLDRRSNRTVRVAAKESGHRRAQEMFAALEKEEALQAGYRALPDDDLFAKRAVRVTLAPEDVPGYWAARVLCDGCGEGIAFGRESLVGQRTLCRTCAGENYYEPL
jgi:formylmethanofuran dehydrogenase subunit E